MNFLGHRSIKNPLIYIQLEEAIFKDADYNFYNIDPALFAPAVIIVNNVKTGSFIKEGHVNLDIIKKSITS